MALRTASVPIPSSRRFRLPRDAMLGYLLLAPAILLLLVLVAYPFLTAVMMSLQKKLIGQAVAPFIGLDNYIALLTDRTFWIVIRNVLIFAGASVAIKLVIGTSVALALNESMPARGIIRSITLLAGLQSVGSDQYDAAKVDGANIVARFRHVTLPGLAPVMAVVTLLSTIFTLNDFAIIWLLTKGGPGNATDVLSTLTYKVAIRGLELGKGVAVSVLMLPLLIVLIVLLTRFINKREEA